MDEIPREGDVPVTVSDTEPELNLERLLEGVTESNKHDEVDTGPSVGKEVL